jgi:addiction module HigA family antidote
MARPAIHPGEILADELGELGVTPTELSRQINVPPNRITQIIKGQRGITGDTALRLGRLVRHERAVLAQPPGPPMTSVSPKQTAGGDRHLPTKPNGPPPAAPPSLI